MSSLDKSVLHRIIREELDKDVRSHYPLTPEVGIKGDRRQATKTLKNWEKSMQIDQATLGKRLREARINCGFSQDAVAQELGIPRTAVVHIEAGNRAVTT